MPALSEKCRKKHMKIFDCVQKEKPQKACNISRHVYADRKEEAERAAIY